MKPHQSAKQPTHQQMTLVQLSDLHLTGSIGKSPSYQSTLQALEAVVKLQPQLILLTGDLVNDGNSDAYDWLFLQLKNTGIAHFAIAGNHDVTHEIGTGLPYHQRLHLPLTADKRLLDCHRLALDDINWQILLLNSSLAGCTHGALSQDTLAWLQSSLAQHPMPTIIALHHHPQAVGSAWIDAYMLSNHQAFWQIIEQHPHVHTIVCGHVHQVHQLHPLKNHRVQLLSCPSTDRQFLPFAHDFTIDKTASAGFRVIHIDSTSRLVSYIKSLDN
ncbi:Icc protein [Moraxella cuniculi DSM 21768]|uniref:Icc protein n=1 Tax=Moraxella cuniculi DSM 21768 TaxID=1122245 RepID=A0A1N7F662_9GAMM|nr:metallophosphoesterase [Moraxella cuniculi]SIR95810.1 Icc protein [Moraxella cuniculi DSM 21768]